jgi:hypothetical protein
MDLGGLVAEDIMAEEEGAAVMVGAEDEGGSL